MNTLKQLIANNKFSIMQIRARGLSTKRSSQLHEDINTMQKSINMLMETLSNKDAELRSIAEQRDAYAKLVPGTILYEANHA